MNGGILGSLVACCCDEVAEVAGQQGDLLQIRLVMRRHAAQHVIRRHRRMPQVCRDEPTAGF